MAKYLTTSSFPLFSIQLHQHILTMGLDTSYFQVLTNLNLTQFFWPEHALHVTGTITTAINRNNKAK